MLEVCDDLQREQLLARVRAQLCTLKKYTYGKHIVARMEKLLSAGAKIQASPGHEPPPLPRFCSWLKGCVLGEVSTGTCRALIWTA